MSATRSPAALHVPTARPSTRAKGRNTPFDVTSDRCRPTTASRETQPSRSGSKDPQQARRRKGRRLLPVDEVDETVGTLDERVPGERETAARVAQR